MYMKGLGCIFLNIFELWYVAMQRDRSSPEEWEDIGFQGKDPASDFVCDEDFSKSRLMTLP